MADIPPPVRHLLKDTVRNSHLRVIEGGKKGKNPFKVRLLTSATLVSLAIAGGGAALGLHSRLHGQATRAAERPLYYSPINQGVSPPPSVKVPEFSGLSAAPARKSAMETMSSRELIGRLLPVNLHGQSVGPEMSRKVIEHNYASLRLEMRGRAAVGELIQALGSDQHEFRRESIAFILGRIGDASALPALRERAEKDHIGAVRAAAKEAIEQIEKR